jgi:hypothetical protein
MENEDRVTEEPLPLAMSHWKAEEFFGELFYQTVSGISPVGGVITMTCSHACNVGGTWAVTAP